MQPKCSIIIPTLNEEFFIPDLLKDLCDQTDTNFEVIVVDAGSRDKTKSVCEAFQKKIQITFYDVARKNVSYQRNYGASRAHADWIVFLDADMRINIHFISSVMNEVHVLSGQVFIPRVVSQIDTLTNRALFAFLNAIIGLSLKTRWPFSGGGSMVFQKKCFTDLKGFDEKVYIAEDHEIVRRAKQNHISVLLFKRTYVCVSMRRLQRESMGALMKKYVIASFLMLRDGRIDRKIFDYSMGGEQYDKNAHTSINNTKVK